MNIGLVLSGGMAKGAYQVGALKALQELVPREAITCISCASIGVLNAYAYATDRLDRAEAMWRSLCTDGTRFIISQVLRSSLLQQNIAQIYERRQKLSAPFYASLLDITHRDIVYKDLSAVDESRIPLYLKASVAMPVYNRAVKIGEHAYFDGAMIDNIPVFPLLERALDYVICMYFDDTCYQFENTVFDSKVIKITFPTENRLKQSLVFRQEGIDEMIHSGYEQTRQLLCGVFAQGYEDVAAVRRAIRYGNRAKSNSLRITGDVLVTNLNKITQRLTKRKIV